MKFEIWPSCQEVGKRAAGMIGQKLKRDPHAMFALPAGTTPLATYAQLAAWYARGDPDAPWFCGQVEQVPGRAITVGMRTILEARAVILLACGTSKARVIARAPHDLPDPALPASLLRRHPRLALILDQAAASLLWPKHYQARRPLRRPCDDRPPPADPISPPGGRTP